MLRVPALHRTMPARGRGRPARGRVRPTRRRVRSARGVSGRSVGVSGGVAVLTRWPDCASCLAVSRGSTFVEYGVRRRRRGRREVAASCHL